MPSAAALLRKLDKTLFVQRRPGDDDPAAAVTDRYGDRIDSPAAGAANEQRCRGSYEFIDRLSGENVDPEGRNAGVTGWLMFVEPGADIRRTDLIVERADPDVDTSDVLHTFDVRAVELVTSFRGVASHWEVLAEEHS